MRDGGPLQRNSDQVLLGVFNTLADGVRDFAGFTKAEADKAVAVTDNNKSSELIDTTTLDGLETRLMVMTRS